MLVASQLPFREIIGIELNPDLAATAQRNLAHFVANHSADPTASPLAPIRLLHQDALTFDLPATPLRSLPLPPLRSPCPPRPMLRRIETQFATQSNPTLDILYVNAECRSILDRHPAFTRLFLGPIAMSPEDHIADLAAIADQKEYGSTGDEECAIYRYTGRRKQS